MLETLSIRLTTFIGNLFLLIIPFANIVFRTPLLAKLKIPQFIVDYMTRDWILLTVLVVFYVVIFIFGTSLFIHFANYGAG